MAAKKTIDKTQVAACSNFLLIRRETMLNNWRQRCALDQHLTSKSTFSREEFNDQMPVLLDILHQRLNDEPPVYDPLLAANEHGLHRWQSGYELPDLIIEMEHLFAILHEEVHSFEQAQEHMSPTALSKIYREIYQIYSESCRGSIVYYHELRQTTAAEQAARLQQALDQLQELAKMRSEHLRHSSHDLRSSFSVLLMSSHLWQLDTSDLDKTELIGMLNRNLNSIRDMLLQLTDFARIEAGQETLVTKKFDVAAMIRETTDLIRPAAEAKKLTLMAEGPEKLMIDSDRVQIQRVLQNLLYNAIKYTQTGSINVTWAPESEARWILSVQDTGPGFAENSPVSLLADQLRPPIHSPAIYQEMLQKPAPTVSNKKEKVDLKESEGLGLFIVKKICELMKASMDIESKPGFGTLVRIKFQCNQEQNRQA
ncbi:HAMP domain-containing sensor histidine kinase [Dyadobacter sp. CY343]|uniref:sensor histidine kinase n=1 Tax=Dyadobacter sp. CY343 TaxID=2907299 RepID=UPI001F327786|nr:HAMP domain-containing sensor histidine kinase [Dyadobacter sp. CY343]MCE7060765.1 HAMP domain-containing histidine kinase [Dyadobacter sp. CY343]